MFPSKKESNTCACNNTQPTCLIVNWLAVSIVKTTVSLKVRIQINTQRKYISVSTLTLSKYHTKIAALERPVASSQERGGGGLKDILHCPQSFALDLGCFRCFVSRQFILQRHLIMPEGDFPFPKIVQNKIVAEA